MLTRHAAWVLLAALACVPAPPPQMPPDAPVLEGDGVLSVLPNWKLQGSAPEGTLVRVYVDVECRGPAWRDFTAEELLAGVEIDLVSGTENVFAAVTIDASGVASECSAPVRVRYVRPLPPQRPNTRVIPSLPTRETHFEIRGSATDAVTVRLFEVSCQSGTPIATLSEADYQANGFAIDVLPNRSFVFALDALNVLGERSSCTPPVALFSDQTPPVVTAILKSPTPDRTGRAYVQITAEGGVQGYAQLGTGCIGDGLATCNGSACSLVEVVFPEVAVQSWSAYAIDSLGNRSACVDSAEPWGWDPLADPAVQLFVNGQTLTALVPTSSEWVEIYSGPTCDPFELKNRLTARQMIAGTGTWLFAHQTDGGVLTARGTSADGGIQYPCSPSVPWN